MVNVFPAVVSHFVWNYYYSHADDNTKEVYRIVDSKDKT